MQPFRRLARLVRDAFRPALPRAPRRRALTLERLEDRDVPTTFTVTSSADSGPGTLRQAIIDAQVTLADGDLIVLDSMLMTGIDLRSPLPTLLETHTIRYNAPYAGALLPITINSAYATPNSFRFAEVAINGAALTLENLYLHHFGTTGDGGAILSPGQVTMNNCEVQWCSAEGNGGVVATGGASLGHLTLTNCYFHDNTAEGNGGVVYSNASFSLPVVTITGSRFYGNDAGGSGGAICFNTAEGELNITETFMSANHAGGLGGAIYQGGGYLYYYNAGGDMLAWGVTGNYCDGKFGDYRPNGIFSLDPQSITVNVFMSNSYMGPPSFPRDIVIYDPPTPASVSIAPRLTVGCEYIS